MALIETKALRKRFRVRKQGKGPLGLWRRPVEDVWAVDGISFDVEEGEIVGYIGPNGAGKSTTVKCLTGILVPTSGSVSVAGVVPWRNRTRNALHIGVVFGQKTALWWDVPVIETYRLLRDIYNIPSETFTRNLSLLDEILGIKEFRDTPVRQLSLGQRMRADLGAAMLHNPRILFLDEPTIGLDVSAKDRLRNFIRDINRATRVTIFLTTHDMAEVERLCSRILIIDQGRLVYGGTIEAAISRFAPTSVLVVKLDRPTPEPVRLPGCETVQTDPLSFRVVFRRDETTARQLVGQLMDTYSVKDFRVEDPTIEQIVKTVYEGRLSPTRASGE